MNQVLVYVLGILALLFQLAVAGGVLFAVLVVFHIKHPKLKEIFLLVIEPGIITFALTLLVAYTMKSPIITLVVAFMTSLVWLHILLNKFYKTEFQRSFAIYLVAGIILFILNSVSVSIASNLFFNVQIIDNSMNPTFSENTQVLSTTLVKNYKRGDIVYLQTPEISYVVRRIIGLPGETIEIKDGEVFANGQELSEDFIRQTFCQEPVSSSGNSVTTLYGEPIAEDNFAETDTVTFPNTVKADCEKPFVLGENEFFVLGDNTDTAYDSRHFGAIQKNSIYGKVLGKSGWRISF